MKKRCKGMRNQKFGLYVMIWLEVKIIYLCIFVRVLWLKKLFRYIFKFV